MVIELPADPPLHLGAVLTVLDRVMQQTANRGVLAAAEL
jgi:hypothetical protein